jgi:hypothetical protein
MLFSCSESYRAGAKTPTQNKTGFKEEPIQPKSIEAINRRTMTAMAPEQTAREPRPAPAANTTRTQTLGTATPSSRPDMGYIVASCADGRYEAAWRAGGRSRRHPKLFTGVRGRVFLQNSGACQSCVSFTSSHLYARLQYASSHLMLPDVGNHPRAGLRISFQAHSHAFSEGPIDALPGPVDAPFPEVPVTDGTP